MRFDDALVVQFLEWPEEFDELLEERFELEFDELFELQFDEELEDEFEELLELEFDDELDEPLELEFDDELDELLPARMIWPVLPVTACVPGKSGLANVTASAVLAPRPKARSPVRIVVRFISLPFICLRVA